jgi:D-alanine-D-alanine ligase
MKIGIVRTAGSPCQCAQSVIRGLEALGHGFVLADSEEIEFRASELARECDLVIDHTDTFRGKGLLRPLVRLLMETVGARVVGSDARACLLADDKAAAKARLAEAGVPTPPGIILRSAEDLLPGWLAPPLVLKPAFEHMSRGLGLVRSSDQARRKAGELLERLQQPLLAEMYIPGRELAVSLLEGPGGLEVLPPLEWRLEEAGPGILTEDFKLKEVAGERRDALRADLPARLGDDLAGLARLAFRALGLRDYARFDLWLSPGGTFYFLEANTTPSLEPLEALSLSAGWAGLDYPALVERMLDAALRRCGGQPRGGARETRIDLPAGPVVLRVPPGVHFPPPSSIDLASVLDVKPGEKVLDLGCGTGLLSIAAARLGAARVVATDLDPQALEVTAHNARVNGVGKEIEVRAGSWYEALDAGKDGRFDVILATPPQTPGPFPFGPKYGGEDGTAHLFGLIDGARGFLDPSRGRLWLLAISLANPSGLRQRLGECFADVTLVKETDRFFTAEEYQSLDPGLFPHFVALRDAGRAEFEERGGGRYAFRNLCIRASGVKAR